MTPIFLCIFFSSSLSIVLGSDSGCLSEHGHCQEDSTTCHGNYRSGLCSGHSTRRCCIPTGTHSGSTCSNVKIISRAEWGAHAAKSKSPEQNPLPYFFIHHTDTPECTTKSTCESRVRNIQSYHQNTRGWSDIGYSFLVGGDGNIYEGRGWDIVGAHTAGYNSKGYAASFIGDFTSKLPTPGALQAVKNLIACGVQLGKLSSSYHLYGHRDAGSTSCPGNTLYAEIQRWPHYSHVRP